MSARVNEKKTEITKKRSKKIFIENIMAINTQKEMCAGFLFPHKINLSRVASINTYNFVNRLSLCIKEMWFGEKRECWCVLDGV
jgi:hypothetical protein